MSDEIRHIITHSLGLCGEGHPSLLAFLGYIVICIKWLKSKMKEARKW